MLTWEQWIRFVKKVKIGIFIPYGSLEFIQNLWKFNEDIIHPLSLVYDGVETNYCSRMSRNLPANGEIIRYDVIIDKNKEGGLIKNASGQKTFI